MIRFGYLRIRELYLEDVEAIPAVLRFVKEYAIKCDLPMALTRPAHDELVPYLEDFAGTKLNEPYAWYVKIPSVKNFLNHITPVLEERLRKSIYRNLDDEISISYYDGGIILTFQKGKIVSIKELSLRETQTKMNVFDLYIPPNNLIQLLMGFKTIAALESINFDFSCSAKKKHLLNTLFPLMKTSLTPTI